MSFCSHCGQKISAEACACPACGEALHRLVAPVAPVAPAAKPVGALSEAPAGALWPAILSLILGVFSLLCCLVTDEEQWDVDIFVGFALFAGSGLALGVFSLQTQTTARGIAIAGVVLSSLSGILLFSVLL